MSQFNSVRLFHYSFQAMCPEILTLRGTFLLRELFKVNPRSRAEGALNFSRFIAMKIAAPTAKVHLQRFNFSDI